MSPLDHFTGCGKGGQNVLADCSLQDGFKQLLIQVDFDHVGVELVIGKDLEAGDPHRPVLVLLKAV